MYIEANVTNPNAMDVDENNTATDGDGEVYQIAPRLISLLETVNTMSLNVVFLKIHNVFF